MKDQRGAALIEVLGASAILGIVIAALLYVAQYMALAERTTRLETEALRLAEEKLSYAGAYIRSNGALPPNEADAGGYSVVYQIAWLGDEGDPVEYDTHLFGARHLSLQTVMPGTHGGQTRLALLTVTVSWGDGE